MGQRDDGRWMMNEWVLARARVSVCVYVCVHSVVAARKFENAI